MQRNPKPSTITDEEYNDLHRVSEAHDVPFGCIRVKHLKSEVLRESLSQFFDPKYDTDLGSIFSKTLPSGKYDESYAAPDMSEVLVSARFILTYPLHQTWELTAEFSASRLGDLFSIAYDMYEHIYDLDMKEWRAEGHQDKAPRAGEKSMNRARGKHVWGHDMDDLFFEGVRFIVNPNWNNEKRKRLRIVKLEDALAEHRGEKERPPPEFDDCPEALTPEHKGRNNFLGTFLFEIGS